VLGGAAPPSLERRLGPWDAAAIVISNVIGVGIFITPSFIATLLPNRMAILGVWAIGGVLALFGALAYAELAARSPEAGGEYVYLREAFGGLAAFLTGWTSFVAGFSGAIAAGGVGIAAYLDRLIPGVGNAVPIGAWHIGPLAMTLSLRALVAIAVIVALALVQMRGVALGRVLQNALTTLKVVALLVFAGVGLLVTRVSTHAAFSDPVPLKATSWLFALVPVMFSYSGWNAAVYVAEEIKHPVRNVPRALIIGTAGTVALYLALNALYLRVVPHVDLSGTVRTVPCAVPSGSYCDGFAVIDLSGATIAVDTYAYLGAKPACRSRWAEGTRVASLSGVWQQRAAGASTLSVLALSSCDDLDGPAQAGGSAAPSSDEVHQLVGGWVPGRLVSVHGVVVARWKSSSGAFGLAMQDPDGAASSGVRLVRSRTSTIPASAPEVGDWIRVTARTARDGEHLLEL